MCFVPLQPARTFARPGSTQVVTGRARRRGFTLIEAAVATVIIGIGVLAIVELLAVGTASNSAGTQLTTAMNLANNINEWSMRTSYENLRTTFNDKTFCKDALGADLADFDGWKQVVDVQYVDPNAITLAVSDTQLEPTSRLIVTVTRHGRSILTTSFLRCASQWPLPPSSP